MCYNYNQVEEDGVCRCKPGKGYYDKKKHECITCPGKCLSCDQDEPDLCLTCEKYYKLDFVTKKCFSCAENNRPERLITPDCPELYELKLVKSEFEDNEKYIDVYLDRDTLSTKKNPSDEIMDYKKLDWVDVVEWWVTVEGEPDKSILMDSMIYYNITRLNIDGKEKVQQRARFVISPVEFIHYKKKKLIYAKFRKYPVYFVLNFNAVAVEDSTKAMILDPKPVNMTIVKSKDSD